jgi:hypothetical protein
LGARKLERKGKSVGMATALGHGLWAFFRIYIIKRGFWMDGRVLYWLLAILKAHFTVTQRLLLQK